MLYKTLNMAIVGSGGDGVISIANSIIKYGASQGYYGVTSRASGPQIRGGEVAGYVRLSTNIIGTPARRQHLVVAFNVNDIKVFKAELVMREETTLIYDNSKGDIPDDFILTAGNTIGIPFNKIAKSIPGGRVNMIALGVIASILKMKLDVLHQQITTQFINKGENIVNSSIKCLNAGYEFLDSDSNKSDNTNTNKTTYQLESVNPNNTHKHILISGNEASGLGALKAGIRFVAAYPITPATEVLEWIAPKIKELGGSLVQAEDELASIGMVIGASFGGIPSLTATSGPGLSLMQEFIGLSVTAEVPATIINVMRGGPSTGIPTKTEQSDLNSALFGAHGDNIKITVAPNSIEDCIHATQWAVYLAEELQTLSIVLSDQLLGQTIAVIDKPIFKDYKAQRKLYQENLKQTYNRYLITDDNISPMAIPAQKNGEYTATGLEHLENARPSSDPLNHRVQLGKRRDKIISYDYGDYAIDVKGSDDATTAFICFGSITNALYDAQNLLAHEQNTKIKVISIRLLSPLPLKLLHDQLKNISDIIVIEQNHMQQLYRYLKSFKLFDTKNHISIAEPGPLPLRGIDVVRLFNDTLQNNHKS